MIGTASCLFVLAITGALAEEKCLMDLLVDDFKKANLTKCFLCDPTHPLRYFNLIEGDYGAKDATSIYILI
jgi:hypothetical protein